MAGRDWSGMGRADFDEGEPLALVEAHAVVRRVEAAPHANGTDALFGDAPTGRRGTRAKRPARGPAEEPDALF
ncbi:hypothetical protein ACFU96_21345 [Streptomyces sp. NPDC057620]|uniref:hypothetical protein n=1 Tax=Streptomyces sp. NPDC057620 TaxID=3346185 RepID=UPI00369FE43B